MTRSQDEWKDTICEEFVHIDRDQPEWMEASFRKLLQNGYKMKVNVFIWKLDGVVNWTKSPIPLPHIV